MTPIKKITGANAGGLRQLAMRTHWAARVAQFTSGHHPILRLITATTIPVRRNRRVYAIATALVIGAGLLWRSGLFPLPDFVAKYGGDSLWALVVFLGLGSLMVKQFIRPLDNRTLGGRRGVRVFVLGRRIRRGGLQARETGLRCPCLGGSALHESEPRSFLGSRGGNVLR